MIIKYRHNKKIQIIILLSILNLFLPLIGFFLNSIFYLFTKLSLKEKKLIFFNISFSIAFIGFLYFRTNDTGDLSRYAESLYNYGISLLNGRSSIIEGIYEAFYSGWYFLFYLVNKLHLNIQYINFLAGFTIYASILYILFTLSKKYNSIKTEKVLFVKIFLLISIIAVYSSYKTLWAFSLVFLGLYLIMNNKRIGSLFLLLGMSLHPVAWFPVLIYFFSKFFKFKFLFLYIFFLIGLFSKIIIKIFVSKLLYFPFIGSKINTYVYGEWAIYRFQDNGEYVKFFLLVLIIIFVFNIFIFKLVNIKSFIDNFYKKYINFILWYFSFSLLFLEFRTIEMRLLLDGIIFFLPLFYLVFLTRKIYKKRMLFVLFIWFILIDVRTFNINNNSYQIGLGFPYNLIESPIFLVVKENL